MPPPIFNVELDEWGEKEIVHDNTTLLLFCAIVSAETGPIRVGTASLSYYSGDTEQVYKMQIELNSQSGFTEFTGLKE